MSGGGAASHSSARSSFGGQHRSRMRLEARAVLGDCNAAVGRRASATSDPSPAAPAGQHRWRSQLVAQRGRASPIRRATGAAATADSDLNSGGTGNATSTAARRPAAQVGMAIIDSAATGGDATRDGQCDRRQAAVRRWPRRSRQAALAASAKRFPPGAIGVANATVERRDRKRRVGSSAIDRCRIERTGPIDRANELFLRQGPVGGRRAGAAAPRRRTPSRKAARGRPSSIPARRLTPSQPPSPTRHTPRP